MDPRLSKQKEGKLWSEGFSPEEGGEGCDMSRRKGREGLKGHQRKGGRLSLVVIQP